MSEVDVIVLDIDGGAMLDACIESILRQTLVPRHLIVFDNGSVVPVSQRLPWDRGRPAGTSRAVGPGPHGQGSPATNQPELVLLRSETNIGFAAGVNAAVARSTADFVALVNNDVVLDDHWLATLTQNFSAGDAALQTWIRKDAAVFDGAGIDISDGTIRQAGHGFPLGSHLPPAWGVSATAALYRRQLLRFDERFFAYYEDVELCARLHGQGWQTRVLPIDKATHRGSASAAKLGSRARYLRTRNRYWVARLHPGVGRIRALLVEDLKLLAWNPGSSSLRGIIDGLMEPLR